MNDVRFAIRTLLRTPAFTLTAVITLALGIGATTAVFSVVDAVLLKPLPYRDPDRLVVTRLSLPDYRDVQRTSRSFEETAVWATNLYNLRTGDETRQVPGGVVSRGLLPLLGVVPVLGRTFTEEDDRQRTVILGYGLWQSLFGGDPGALGRSVELSGSSYTVIGVAPAGFRFPSGEFQLWTPMGLLETDARPQAENRGLRIFSAIGRLKPGATVQQSRAELIEISRTLAQTYPSTNAEIVLRLDSLNDRILGDARTPLFVVLTTVGLLLLIACANVANLMLARRTAREREMAIRSAVGAGRARLFRQLVVETLVLALAGGALGVLLAAWAVDLMPSVLDARLPRADTVRLDGTVLLVALATTLLTSLVFGTAPALRTSADLGALKEAGRGRAPRSGRTLRRSIVLAEVVLAVAAVTGAGLLVRSFMVLTARDPGFVPDNVVAFNVQFVAIDDAGSRRRAAAALVERLSSMPGVESAGGSTGLPTVTPQRGTRFEIEGRVLMPAESGAHLIAATPGYFASLRAPLSSGRAIERGDIAASQPVAVINRTLANQVFAGQDPVGRRIRLVNPEFSNDWRTIVGVAGDVRYRGLDSDPQPAIYTPFDQTPFPWLYMMVRTTGDATALTQSIRAAVRDADPRLTAASVRPMTDIVSDGIASPRFSMLLVSGFAALALLLASIGIYGVIGYTVAERTQEIGVRMALGAGRGDVLSMIVKEGLLVSVPGVIAGLGAAALGTRLMADLLVGVGARDPLTFAAAGVALIAVALAASYLPARRATRVDPMQALRAQ
jgi:putative ABC transport system permease protein